MVGDIVGEDIVAKYGFKFLKLENVSDTNGFGITKRGMYVSSTYVYTY